MCDALARKSLLFLGKAASQKAEILKSEGQLTAKMSQSSFKKADVSINAWHQSPNAAERIAACTRILEPSKSVTLFIFIMSPMHEYSAAQIPYTTSQRARANDVCKT